MAKKGYEEQKEKILDFYRENRRMPGYQEMMSLFKFKSKNSVYKLLNRLIEHGVIEKDSQGRISPTNLYNLYSELRVLGSIQAGFPTHAEEDFSNTMSLDEYVVGRNRKAHYILTVSGDSMIEAGIQEGDLVIVEKTEQAKIGDIVVACVDEDWTLKYLRKSKSGDYYLEAANSNYEDIHPISSMTIGGVVKGVIRKY